MGKPTPGGLDPRAASKKARKQQAREARKLEQRRQQRASSLKKVGGWSAAVAVVAVTLFFIVRTSGGAVSFSGDVHNRKLDGFSLPALQGSGTVTYASLQDKPLVVNFFASWCPYCISEMPTFERVHQAAGDRVAFLGVSQGDAKKASVDLARQTRITYPTGIDAAGSLFHFFGGAAMPVTVFIAPGGRIAEVHTGELSDADLKRLIQQNLSVTI